MCHTKEKITQKFQTRDPTVIKEASVPSATRSARVKILAEAAMMIALASLLNFIQFFPFPQGGAITLGGMVPILFLALRRGAKVGIAAGMVLSLVILSIPGQGFPYNPIQFLLDYPLAWGALGLAGFFQTRPLISVGVGILGRFTFHFISGIVFIGLFAPTIAMQGTGAVVIYSAVYNGSYLVPEFIISTIVMLLLVKRKLLHVYM